MGLFSNPLGYAGYGPGVTGTPTTQNSTVRAATAAEAATGTLTNCYISPATADSATALDFASPPVLGFGSTTPRPVHATTLSTTSTISLGEGSNMAAGTTTGTKIGTATTQKLGFFNATPIVQPVTTTDIKVALVNLGLLASGVSPLDLGAGALGSGTHTLSDGANIVLGSTNGTKIGTATTQKLAFFNATPIVQEPNTTDLRQLLIDYGLLASGGASPLNLNGGALTAGAVSGTSVVVSTAASVSGATPITNNVTAGQASFTDVVNAGAYGTLVVNSSTAGITASSIILASASCVTASSAVQIAEITPGSNTISFRVFNAGGSNTADNININFWVVK